VPAPEIQRQLFKTSFLTLSVSSFYDWLLFKSAEWVPCCQLAEWICGHLFQWWSFFPFFSVPGQRFGPGLPGRQSGVIPITPLRPPSVSCYYPQASDGSGSKIFDPGWIGSIFCGSGWVGWGQTFIVWVWILKISPKNVKFFNFFPSGQKKSLWVGSESTRVGLYLLRVKSKLPSGQGPSLPQAEAL